MCVNACKIYIDRFAYEMALHEFVSTCGLSRGSFFSPRARTYRQRVPGTLCELFVSSALYRLPYMLAFQPQHQLPFTGPPPGAFSYSHQVVSNSDEAEPWHLLEAIPAVSRLVERLRHLCMHERDPLVSYELEARFGVVTMTPNQQQHHNNIRFQSGVPNIVMERIMQNLASYEDWFGVREFQEMQDFVYPVHEIGDVRTTVMYDDKHTGQLQRRHIHKDRIDSVTLKLVCNNGVMAAAGGNAPYLLDVRVDLNREQEIRDDDPRLPHLQNTSHVRIKQRRSYLYASTGALQPTWQFDVTFSWSGQTKTQAERQQKETPPICEIECELLNPRYMLLESGRDDANVAASLLYKMADFIPLRKTDYRWVPYAR